MAAATELSCHLRKKSKTVCDNCLNSTGVNSSNLGERDMGERW